MIKKNDKQNGFTLIEVLVAMTILIIFLLPVAGLFMLGARGNEFNSSWQDGTKLAHSIMNRLLSEDVPFNAIDPEGFPSGSSAMGGSRSQMDFRDSFGPLDFSDYNLKDILGAKNGAYRLLEGDRIIVKGRRKYKVMVWAGIYKRKGGGSSSLSRGSDPYQSDATTGDEMTYSYYRNPWFDISNDCVISYSSPCDESSKNRAIDPYTQLAGDNAGAPPHISNGITKQNGSNYNDRYRPGWATDIRVENKDFHNFEDLDDDGNDDGAYMKLVVGIHWKPKGGGGSTASSKPQEFFLVSFKANLQGAKE